MSCCNTEDRPVIGNNVSSTKTFYFLGIPILIVEYEQTVDNVYEEDELEDKENAQF